MNKEYKKDYPLGLAKTKTPGVEQKFDLSDPFGRAEYFKAKVGKEIEDLKVYFEKNTFIAYWLGKKNSGKGTYSKLMIDIFGADRISHLSVGDVVRAAHVAMSDEAQKQELLDYLEENYRGYISVDQAIDALLGRDTKTLLPTEFVLALVKREIDKLPKKILFIDGFPRELDQVSYSLYFRNLINYRDDEDIFIAIDIPEAVIDERMKTRVVCPICHAPRSLKLMVTKEIGFDEDKKEFYLACDNQACGHAKMVAKEGDNLGIEIIRERLELDDKLIEKVFALHGVPKVLLRNSVPVTEARELVDEYELTPEFVLELNDVKTVKVSEKPWTIKDDDGVESHSLMAPAVVVSLVKQLHKLFITE